MLYYLISEIQNVRTGLERGGDREEVGGGGGGGDSK